MRVAVVGHHEWVTFARVSVLPREGDIVHATEWWESPGGGGAGAAGQLARLAGEATFFTALGDDDIGHRAVTQLTALGVNVHAVFRDTPTRRAFTHIVPTGERTITVLGERAEPSADDDLPWDALADHDAVYFTAGDEGALRASRRAGVVVATTRIFPFLVEAGVKLDAVVGSSDDPSEVYEPERLSPPPEVVVMTGGAEGGTYSTRSGASGRYRAVDPPAEIVDAYGAGDCFAAGLTFGLGRGDPLPDALALAARCGAHVITGRGPFEAQLRADQL